MKTFYDLLNFLKGITVYALVGASGTGKSYRARLLAQSHGIDFIIDDGLLIEDDKIIAGHSAKKEKFYMGAVRVALFDDKAHRDEIAKVLKKLRLKKILILGTSEKMVNKIAVRLQLPAPSKIINIESIASDAEINSARRARMVEGKHVIPVPAIEVKRTYPSIFHKAIRIFANKNLKNISSMVKNNNSTVFEKSVVTPEFSKKGRVIISEAALTQMVFHSVNEFEPDIKLKKLIIKTSNKGYTFVVTIDVPLGLQLSGKMHKMQTYVIENIEKATGILIEEVSFIIDKIYKPEVIDEKLEKNN